MRLTAIGDETKPQEAEEHHRPCRGFRDGSDRHIVQGGAKGGRIGGIPGIAKRSARKGQRLSVAGRGE